MTRFLTVAVLVGLIPVGGEPAKATTVSAPVNHRVSIAIFGDKIFFNDARIELETFRTVLEQLKREDPDIKIYFRASSRPPYSSSTDLMKKLVETSAEVGVHDFVMVNWRGNFSPATAPDFALPTISIFVNRAGNILMGDEKFGVNELEARLLAQENLLPLVTLDLASDPKTSFEKIQDVVNIADHLGLAGITYRVDNRHSLIYPTVWLIWLGGLLIAGLSFFLAHRKSRQRAGRAN